MAISPLHTYKDLRQRLEVWAARRHPRIAAAVHLQRRWIYILPTGHGYTFALGLLVMFLWSVNYNNNLGFILTFLLAAAAVNAMVMTNGNLVGLRVEPLPCQPVFAGQSARFGYRLTNPHGDARYGIRLALVGQEGDWVNLAAGDSVRLSLERPTARRGRLEAGGLRVSTRHPLGLFEAWSWVIFEHSCLVYPHPAGGRPLPGAARAEGGMGDGGGRGREDYFGLRGYAFGDSPRHVAWKASARSEELLVKEFVGLSQAELWLDWESLDSLACEARLSQLTRWVLLAEEQGRDYGLRLPGVRLEPAHGRTQCRRALESLALYGEDRGR
ncbi:MAG: DUF58 domain-containing protein [Candidatus Competibacteraceae bacterium]|nr:DUF58 domain-containing protein [Candidatus Competibacteraceae bacterium]